MRWRQLLQSAAAAVCKNEEMATELSDWTLRSPEQGAHSRLHGRQTGCLVTVMDFRHPRGQGEGQSHYCISLLILWVAGQSNKVAYSELLVHNEATSSVHTFPYRTVEMQVGLTAVDYMKQTMSEGFWSWCFLRYKIQHRLPEQQHSPREASYKVSPFLPQQALAQQASQTVKDMPSPGQAEGGRQHSACLIFNKAEFSSRPHAPLQQSSSPPPS